jgi:A/G-specific adenine glycosylase
MGVTAKVGDPVGTLQHTYSHFKITLHVYYCRILDGKGHGKWIPFGDLHRFPMSRLHRRIAHIIYGKSGGSPVSVITKG